MLAVVAYPVLSDDDREWIAGVRSRHDPLASRIPAHVTLVFPTEVVEEPLLAHVRSALELFESIPIVLRRAVAFRDAIGSGCYVFLLVDEGHAELVPSTYSSDRLTPPAAGIRDGAHPRAAPSPHFPRSAAAQFEA